MQCANRTKLIENAIKANEVLLFFVLVKLARYFIAALLLNIRIAWMVPSFVISEKLV